MAKPRQLAMPFAELLPPLASTELDALKASIKDEGVLTPVFVDDAGNVLDGHNRLRIDPNAPRRIVRGLTDAEKQAFVFRANFARRNLSPDQKREVLGKMKAVAKALRDEDAKKNTQKRVATLLGVAQQTVADWLRTNTGSGNGSKTAPDARVKVAPVARSTIAERVASGETQAQVAADFGVSQRAISTIVAKETKQQEAKREREKAVKKLGGDVHGIHHGDFRTLADTVANDSLDLIFTDPPYDEDAVALYADLASFAAKKLKPGAWCLAYAGQAFLPDVLRVMGASLRYGWTFCIQHTGGELRFRKFQIRNAWKPIVGFYKVPLSVTWDWFSDIVSGGKEKDEHEWQQSLGEAVHFVEALAPKKGIVCDPMCGSGTTCLAAKQSGRQWIGFEIDKDTAAKARIRVDDVQAA